MTAMPKRKDPTPPGQTLRLLIVEDNPVDAALVTATLKRAGHALSFDIVDSAEECRQRLQRTDYDIILSMRIKPQAANDDKTSGV